MQRAQCQCPKQSPDSKVHWSHSGREACDVKKTWNFLSNYLEILWFLGWAESSTQELSLSNVLPTFFLHYFWLGKGMDSLGMLVSNIFYKGGLGVEKAHDSSRENTSFLPFPTVTSPHPQGGQLWKPAAVVLNVFVWQLQIWRYVAHRLRMAS